MLGISLPILVFQLMPVLLTLVEMVNLVLVQLNAKTVPLLRPTRLESMDN